MNNKRITDLKSMLVAAVFILTFTLALFFAISSLGKAEGDSKAAPAAPDSLVSAGAPRSQLELKRMFEAMSLTYTENGLSVYEPISSEYRRSLEERIAAGEAPLLSVEEILFIISDSSAAYKKYDVIRFKDSSGKIETELKPFDVKQTAASPMHVSALEKISAVTELIELRIRLMSHSDGFEKTETGELKYVPRRVEREKGDTVDAGERAFVFGLGHDDTSYMNAVVFLPGNGSRVTLYPTLEDASLCRTKVILHTDREPIEIEKTLLSTVWKESDRIRNITPEYFYGITYFRLFALGGRVAVADAGSGTAALLLPEDHRLLSIAVTITGEGAAELYFTASDGKRSSLWIYRSGESAAEKLFESDSECIAVIEPITGGFDRVAVYRAVRREDENAVTAVECIGDLIAEY